MQDSNLKVTCLSVDCPERKGGKCWFDKPITTIDKIMIDKQVKDFLKNPDLELSEEFEKLLNKFKDEIYGKT